MKLPIGYYHKGGMTVESTKKRILETALTLFARNGYVRLRDPFTCLI